MNSIIDKSQWIITAIGCFLFLAVSVTSTAVLSTDLYHNNKFRKPFKIGFENALRNLQKEVSSSSSSALSLVELKQDFSDLRGGGKSASSSSTKSVPGILKWAYSAVGIATTAAWTTIVLTTIRSNQPVGALLPTMQHGLVNRISTLSAVPLILSSYGFLIKACESESGTWTELSSTSCRRQNLALAVTGVAGALFVNFAPLITKLPGADTLSHQVYTGMTKKLLLGAFISGAALSTHVWKASLPEASDIPFHDNIPLLSLPGRVADEVSKSMFTIAPCNINNPVNVKYALLTTGFLILTAIQTLGQHPVSVIPSWTGRRLSRIFPAWTLLAAVTSFNLKEATEHGDVLLHRNRILSRGIKGYGILQLTSKAGAVFFDSSWPVHYPAVTAVYGWATAAILFTTLTLRSDQVENSLCNFLTEDIQFIKDCFAKKD